MNWKRTFIAEQGQRPAIRFLVQWEQQAYDVVVMPLDGPELSKEREDLPEEHSKGRSAEEAMQRRADEADRIGRWSYERTWK